MESRPLQETLLPSTQILGTLLPDLCSQPLFPVTLTQLCMYDIDPPHPSVQTPAAVSSGDRSQLAMDPM